MKAPKNMWKDWGVKGKLLATHQCFYHKHVFDQAFDGFWEENELVRIEKERFMFSCFQLSVIFSNNIIK